MKELVSILKIKTEDGLRKLKKTEIGTEEYELLVRQIISNVNYVNEIEQPQQEQPQQFDPQSVIGKEFK